MCKYIVCSIYLSILMSGLVQCKKKEYRTSKECDSNSPDLNKYWAKAIQSALRNANKGESPIKESLAPLHIGSVEIKSDGAVNINLHISNLHMFGINDSTVECVNTDGKKMNFVTKNTKLSLDGTCKIDGKVWGTEIKGDGPCRFEFTDMKTTNKLMLKEIRKDGEKYYEITSFEFNIKAKGMKMNFDNLYDGNTIIGDHMNQFLNANWEYILQALNEALSAAIGPKFKDIGNKVFSKLPVEKITPSKKSD